MRWFWGFLFVLIGFVLLGNNLNWWNQVNLNALWVYWPLLLVILGVAVLTRRWRFNYLLMILIVLLSLSFVFYTGLWKGDILSSSTGVETTDILRTIPDGVKKAKIVVNSAAVKVSIAGKTDKLVEGSFKSNFSKANISENISGETIEYTITTSEKFDGWNGRNTVNDLNLKFSDSIPVELSVDAKASSLNLDLREQKISALSINSGASSVDLTLGNSVESGTKVSIQSGASSLKLKLPKDIGASFNIRSPFSGRALHDTKKINNGQYETNNFADAAKKISFDVNAGASSIDFNSY